jgi:lipoprotein-anchoring transpeptidase ErfK/SrfK
MSRRVIAALLFTGAVSGLLAAFIVRPNLHGVLPSALGGGRNRNATPQPGPDPFVHVVAQGIPAEVPVFAAPDAATQPVMKLSNPTEDGAPLVFLVRDQKPDWLYVLLPVRPNGSAGWVRQADVKTSKHEFRMVVELAAHRLTVYYRDGVFLQTPIGVGRGPTPTPIGVFFTKELLQPPTPDTAYGVYAYGLSGYSNVLTDFAGGDGVVGLHGTNDPSGIGHDVSHGCIRMSNDAITRLAKNLPLGVPVVIRP